MDELLDQYMERFKENFPLFLVRHLDEADINAIIQRCLDTGQVYAPEVEEKSDY